MLMAEASQSKHGLNIICINFHKSASTLFFHKKWMLVKWNAIFKDCAALNTIQIFILIKMILTDMCSYKTLSNFVASYNFDRESNNLVLTK